MGLVEKIIAGLVGILMSGWNFNIGYFYYIASPITIVEKGFSRWIERYC